MAEALISTIGKPPVALLTRLNQGPGAHIRKHAYDYNRTINQELARIARIRDLQIRTVALVGSAIVASMVGVANYVSRTIYELV